MAGKVVAPDGTEVSIKKARALQAELTEEASSLRDDDSAAAKARRVEIGRQLRKLQAGIDALDEMTEVVIPADASMQFPFRIGPKEFWPGTHKVRGQVAQTLRHMMYQHAKVESHRVVQGGNVDPTAEGLAALGKELPAL